MSVLGKKRSRIVNIVLIAIALALLIFILFGKCGSRMVREFGEPEAAGKPVLYLYPQKAEEVTVRLSLNGKADCTYPAYGNGWDVTASPDGKLINRADGKEYSYLFWEGNLNTKYDFGSGFVVRGSDTAAFLQEKLAALGLTPKEYNEFIVYWLPKLQGNPYNLISFQTSAYTDAAKLEIAPKPDSVLRVFMAYKPLSAPIRVPEQKLTPFARKGFAAVEWGGAQAK
jgi:hypothetical protein